MRKLIILLLCCGVIVGMVGCGSNTAPPPTESLPTTVSEMITTETPPEIIPPTTAVEPTEKETGSIESQKQTIEPIATAPLTTKKPTKEAKRSETTNTSEEKVASQIVETVTSITSQHTENETTVTEPTKETVSEPEIIQDEFDINYWITFAKEYAVGVGLALDSEAVSCWDNPIGAGAHCIYLERDIKSRLNRYVKDEDITDVWIWVESIGDDCYNIYIGYA